jgi:uncharacterized membrane protein
MNSGKTTSTIDLILIFAAWLGLILMWYLVLFKYSALPDNIPTHFNLKGEVDAYSSKASVFLLPVVGTILFIGLTILVRYPTQWNYYSKVTPEDAAYHYSWTKTIINYYNFAITLAFSLIIYEIIAVALNNNDGFGVWTLLINLGLFLIPIPYVLTKFFRRRPKSSV